MINLRRQNCAWRRIFGVAALLLIAAATFPGCKKTSPGSNSVLAEQSITGDTAAVDARPAVMVYYFHRTVRCVACLEIEAMAQHVLDQAFTEEQQEGYVVWLPLNMDDPDNQDFTETYELDTSTLVIAQTGADGQERLKKLDKVWELQNNPEAFNRYVRDEIAAYVTKEE